MRSNKRINAARQIEQLHVLMLFSKVLVGSFPVKPLLFRLDKVGDIDRHLLDGGVVERLDVAHVADIIPSHKVDGYTLTTETSGATDSVDVVLPELQIKSEFNNTVRMSPVK